MTTKVALFCGGRGSATIIRELLRTPEVQLALLVNAYDDGLSTGALRKFIPGMLGPSDFRKNFSYLLDLHSAQQYALKQLLEFRLPPDFVESQIDGLDGFERPAKFDRHDHAPAGGSLLLPGPASTRHWCPDSEVRIIVRDPRFANFGIEGH